MARQEFLAAARETIITKPRLNRQWACEIRGERAQSARWSRDTCETGVIHGTVPVKLISLREKILLRSCQRLELPTRRKYKISIRDDKVKKVIRTFYEGSFKSLNIHNFLVWCLQNSQLEL